jgi:hypothetical protein
MPKPDFTDQKIEQLFYRLFMEHPSWGGQEKNACGLSESAGLAA